MPAITLRKPLYDALVRNDKDPTEFANEATRRRLQEEHGIEVEL